MTTHTHTQSSEQHIDNTTNSLRLAFFINFGFTLLEIIGGIWTNSFAIVADALHDLGDSLSLGIVWYLEKYAQKEADTRFSYGYQRFSLLGAILNTLVLVGGGVWVLVNAIPRLINPEPTDAGGMLLLALVGIVVNGLAAFRLYRLQSLNAQVAGWHLVEDVLGWVAVLAASLILLFTDWYVIDPILSILITIFVLINVVRKLKRALELFLQAAPDNINIPELERRIQALDAVQNVHHLHIWSLDGAHHVLTSHVVVSEAMSKEAASCLKKQIIQQVSRDEFEHVTLEIEFGKDDCRLL